jgi:hypothetical protein
LILDTWLFWKAYSNLPKCKNNHMYHGYKSLKINFAPCYNLTNNLK